MTFKDALAEVEAQNRPGTRKYAERMTRKFRYENFENITDAELDAWFIGTYNGLKRGIKEGYRVARIEVARALRERGRSQTETAAILGVSQSTAHRLLKEP